MHIKAPERYDFETRIFLGGSIEMGTAEEWQEQFSDAFRSTPNIVLLNPRRDRWDPAWGQSLDDERFVEQVEWELAMLERADIVAMYFCPDTKSAITLLEFGLYARSGKLIVCCPGGFWRKGNVDVVCRRYCIPQAPHMDGLIDAVRERLR
jgi:nucleoside 2-deoxyribosyltransferase-like protein